MDRKALRVSPIAAAAIAVMTTTVFDTTIADDNEIFLIESATPNVVILLDSSASMEISTLVSPLPKMGVAKSVITNLVQNANGINFGVFRFNSDGTGGEMVAPLGSSTSFIVDEVNAIVADGSTPLGRALADIEDYYREVLSYQDGPACDPGDDSAELTGLGADADCVSVVPGSFDFLACQKNYVIVVTDGLPNGEDENLVANVASDLYHNDHSTYPELQNAVVYTVGFDVPEGTELLQATATNGGGAFYAATDGPQLEAAFSAALTDILSRVYHFASPTFQSTAGSGAGQAYLASFETSGIRPFWNGYLKAYTLDSSGMIPLDADGKPLESSVAWEAGARLATRTASSRTIYTAVDGRRQSFTASNASLTPSLLDVADADSVTDIVSFVRGTDAFDVDGDGSTSEQREWKLGAIFHSSPTFVGPPPLKRVDDAYEAFKADNESRTPIVLVGGNDGMVHAFRASDGYELWGFVPPAVLDDLKALTPNVGGYRDTVDGTATVADVILSGSWRTVALIGLRRGGNSYVALDITDTTDPVYLWSFTDARMGETWSTPVVGRIRMEDGTSKHVAFIGGGYDTDNNNATGDAVYAIDLDNGDKLWEYYNDNHGDARKMNFSIPASPAAVDINYDGYVDVVYVGDVGGQMWRFDVSAPAELSSGIVSNWSGKLLFAAAPNATNPPPVGEYLPSQAIYGSPAVAFDQDDHLFVVFGTGDRNHPTAESSNHFYAVVDDQDMTEDSFQTEASLTAITGESSDGAAGWHVALAAREKVLDSPQIFDGAVFFTTFTPETTAICDAQSGDAKIYALGMTSGFSADLWEIGEDNDGDGAKSIGTGLPSAALLTVDGSGNPMIAATTTDNDVSLGALDTEIELRIRYWRELY